MSTFKLGVYLFEIDKLLVKIYVQNILDIFNIFSAIFSVCFTGFVVECERIEWPSKGAIEK